MKALIIDHDDSFTENLRHWLWLEYTDIKIITYNNIASLKSSTSYDLIAISPGPKRPEDYPNTLKFLTALPILQPVLGICLGMQMMAYIEGGQVQAYQPPVHGKKSFLKFKKAQQEPRFSFFEKPISVARYHSLKCELPDSFNLIAESEEDHIPMWIEHKHKKLLGFQFHPESFLTEQPEQLLKYVKNWANL